GVTGATTNITGLKHTQEALAKREAQLAEAQQLAQVGSWEWDIATDQVTWSDEHYRIWGLDPQDGPLTCEAILKRVHPDDVKRVQTLAEACAGTGEPVDYDARVLRLD